MEQWNSDLRMATNKVEGQEWENIRKVYLWAGGGGQLLSSVKAERQQMFSPVRKCQCTVYWDPLPEHDQIYQILWQVLNIIIIQWIMCQVWCLISIIHKSGVNRKQTAELNCFGCYSYVHQFIWFHKCWFITSSSSLHVRWCNKIILNLKCKSHHIMEASVMLVQYLWF